MGDGTPQSQSTLGQHYDLRDYAYQATQTPGITTDGDQGWMEWVIASDHDTAFTSGRFYVDNFRFEDSLPVPEPASFILLGLAIPTLVLLAHRRRCRRTR